MQRPFGIRKRCEREPAFFDARSRQDGGCNRHGALLALRSPERRTGLFLDDFDVKIEEFLEDLGKNAGPVFDAIREDAENEHVIRPDSAWPGISLAASPSTEVVSLLWAAHDGDSVSASSTSERISKRSLSISAISL